MTEKNPRLSCMKKDESIIPKGEFCYSIKRIQPGEVLCEDIERFGKDLREYRYHQDWKEILCPYWRLTDYGTVICDFLDIEVVFEDDWDAREKIKLYLETTGETKVIGHDCLLSDQVKICDINADEDTEWIE